MAGAAHPPLPTPGCRRREAALGPVRELGAAVASVRADRIRPIALRDFSDALQAIRPSLNKEQLKAFEDFTRSFGTV